MTEGIFHSKYHVDPKRPAIFYGCHLVEACFLLNPLSPSITLLFFEATRQAVGQKQKAEHPASSEHLHALGGDIDCGGKLLEDLCLQRVGPKSTKKGQKALGEASLNLKTHLSVVTTVKINQEIAIISRDMNKLRLEDPSISCRLTEGTDAVGKERKNWSRFKAQANTYLERNLKDLF